MNKKVGGSLCPGGPLYPTFPYIFDFLLEKRNAVLTKTLKRMRPCQRNWVTWLFYRQGQTSRMEPQYHFAYTNDYNFPCYTEKKVFSAPPDTPWRHRRNSPLLFGALCPHQNVCNVLRKCNPSSVTLGVVLYVTADMMESDASFFCMKCAKNGIICKTNYCIFWCYHGICSLISNYSVKYIKIRSYCFYENEYNISDVKWRRFFCMNI